jgi:hypothetical protein
MLPPFLPIGAPPGMGLGIPGRGGELTYYNELLAAAALARRGL